MNKKLNLVNALLATVWILIMIGCALNLRELSVEQILSFTPENLRYTAVFFLQ